MGGFLFIEFHCTLIFSLGLFTVNPILSFLHFMRCFLGILTFLILYSYRELECLMKNMVALLLKIHKVQLQYHKDHSTCQHLFVRASQEIDRQDCHKNFWFCHHYQLACLNRNRLV